MEAEGQRDGDGKRGDTTIMEPAGSQQSQPKAALVTGRKQREREIRQGSYLPRPVYKPARDGLLKLRTQVIKVPPFY